VALASGQQSSVKAQPAAGPERTVAIKVLGPDGGPLNGVTAHSLTGMGSTSSAPSKTAELTAVAPQRGRSRLVWFAHERKKLAGAVTISGDSPGPYTVKMVPWASVTGHVLGIDKKPRSGLLFQVQAGVSDVQVDVDSFAYWRGPVESDGSFHVERIVPGLATQAFVLEQAISFGHPGPKLSLKPGETIDVGTIVLSRVEIPQGTRGKLAAGPPPPADLPLAPFDESKANAEYKVDFRQGSYDIRWLRIDGPGGTARLVQPEKAGLHFTVPAGLGQGATVATKFGIAGDFEITGTFEALSRGRPEIGWGMGPEIFIKPPGGWDKFASAGRFLRPEATVYSLVHGFKAGEEKKYDAIIIPTESRTGRFRLVRTGTTLHFQVAEGEAAEFHQRFTTEFGSEPLEFVRLAAVTGGSQKMVDVLWKDLTVRAEELHGFSSPIARPNQVARNLGWLIAVVLALAAPSAVVWWRAAGRKGANGRGGKGLAGPEKTDKPIMPDAWDEATLTRIETAAAAFAQAHPRAPSCGQRPRCQFSLRKGKLHGRFIAWKAVTDLELNSFGSTWSEIRAKLQPLFTGSYRDGKRNGRFSYYDDEGRASHRRYRDGREVDVGRRGEPVTVEETSGGD
jgi:hypothetical protein